MNQDQIQKWESQSVDLKPYVKECCLTPNEYVPILTSQTRNGSLEQVILYLHLIRATWNTRSYLRLSIQLLLEINRILIERKLD